MAEQADLSGQPERTASDDQNKPVAQLPHFSMRNDSKRPSVLRPPAKPFFKTSTSAEKSMSEKAALERPSGDRSFIERMGVMAPTASYTPPPKSRVTEIPNLNAVRALDVKGDDKKLTISKHIKVSGEISGCEKLVVEGEVDATLTGVKFLDVAASGRVSGKADVDSTIVAGSFDGTLIVRGHLEIPAGGVVRGAISYKTVAVADGAKLSGTITLLDA